MASSGFRLFSPAHLAIIAGAPAAGAGLAWMSRRRPRATRTAVGGLLLANEIAWWTWRFSTEGNRFPEGMPLQLCDLTLWLTLIALFTLSRTAYDVAYFAGLAGSGMAILTPELWAPLRSYPSAYYFLAHGGVVASILMLAWSGLARPRPGSVLRTVVILNAFALAIGVYNAVFGTNYMYLCRKPAAPTLLDVFGPWPIYLIVGEAVMVALFALMYLPFRSAASGSDRRGWRATPAPR